MESKTKLELRDYMKVSYRSYFLQNGFNYGNYQGIGYSLTLYPALRKIYEDDQDMFKQVLEENIEFYNTNPQTLPFITSIHLAMLDSGKTNAEARSLKMALMGPLSGIGDSLSQFIIAPLFSTIGATMAMDGNPLGPLFFIFGINLTLIGIKGGLGYAGYKFGVTLIEQLDTLMSSVTDFATKIGVAVIAGLSVSMVKIYTPLNYVSTVNDETKSHYIQEMLNSILPGLLPLFLVSILFYLITKKNYTTTKLVIIIVIVGIILANLGLITNVNPLG